MSVMRTIKDYFKEEFLLDLVFIQCGCFYEVYDEDASFLENDSEFKFKTFKKGKDLLATGIHVDHVLKLTKKLDQKNLNYVFLSQEESDNDFIRVSTISNKSDCLGVGFSRSGMFLNSTKESLSKEHPKEIQNKTYNQPKDNFPDDDLSSLDIFLDPYDARRVSLYHGLIQFPSYYKDSDGSLKEKLLPLQQKNSQLQEIFQASVVEAFHLSNREEARQRLQWVSKLVENELDEDNFYSQFMQLVDQSTTHARVETHSVIQGSQKFNPKIALKIFFEFEDIDFQDFRFGEHGWESTEALPLDKKRIQDALNKLHGLDFEDSLKILDQL